MNEKPLLCSIFLLMFVFTYQGFAQVEESGGKVGESASKEVRFKRQLTGKIGHMRDLGGYYIYGTPEEYVIANQNPEVLGRLAESKRTVKVDGWVSQGTGFLTIERIDGEPYQGSVKPYSKEALRAEPR